MQAARCSRATLRKMEGTQAVHARPRAVTTSSGSRDFRSREDHAVALLPAPDLDGKEGCVADDQPFRLLPCRTDRTGRELGQHKVDPARHVTVVGILAAPLARVADVLR